MITVSAQHNLGLAGIKANVQTWLDYNFMWPAKARLNGLQYTWLGDTQVQLSGTVGKSKYNFTATLALSPSTIAVSASDPPSLTIGVKKGWQDELGKIVGIPTTLPPRTKITLKYPAGVNQAQAKQLITAALTGATGKRWGTDVAGNPVAYFFMLSVDTPAGKSWDESQVYGILTLLPSGVSFETRPLSVSTFDPGGPAKAKAYGDSWEKLIGKWLAGVSGLKTPAQSQLLKNATPVKGKGKAVPESASGGSSMAPLVIGGLALLALVFKGKRR